MSTGRRLATWVVLDGTAYGPHSDLSAEHAARITNPLAWCDDPRGHESVVEPAEPDLTFPAPDGSSPVPPPRAGKGSGVEAWQAFASRHGLAVEVDADRAAIIAACERAGLVECPTS